MNPRRPAPRRPAPRRLAALSLFALAAVLGCGDGGADTSPDGTGACGSDDECDSGRCDGGRCCAGDCAPRKPLGLTCGAGSECESGRCHGGVCCDSACSGPCASCVQPGAVGQCTHFPAATDPTGDACAPFFCDGVGRCATTCGDDDDCVPGHHCDAGQCRPQLTLGEACSADADCLAGHCADGVCCDGGCGGPCEACDLAGSAGRCKDVPHGLDPDAECAGDGAGCGGYCTGGGACMYPPAGEDCGDCQACDGAGACAPQPAGADLHDDCGACAQCDGAGACEPQLAGADQHDDCPAEGPCGLTGLCDGAGACGWHAAGTVLTPAACAPGNDAVVLPADVCDGIGGISDGGFQSCWPFACDAGACAAGCASGSGCALDAFCDLQDADGDGDRTECIGLLADGSACSGDDADGECAGGECAGGFCCAVAGARCCGAAVDCPAPAPPVCLDSAACAGRGTAVSCPHSVCVQASDPDDDSACEGLPCSAAPACDGLTRVTGGYCDAAGHCVPTTEDCDDDNPCTVDACHPDLGCSHSPDLGLCDDGSPCTVNSCDPVLGCGAVAEDYVSCSDDDACTGPDYCLDGACGGEALVCEDDGNPCTDTACDAVQGCHHLPNDENSCDAGEFCRTYTCSSGNCDVAERDCDDGLFCTGVEVCDDDQDRCVSAGHCFDDGDPCNGTPTCDEDADRCVPGEQLECGDGLACTVDLCDPAQGCVYPPTACVPGLGFELLFANDASLSEHVFTFVDSYTTPAINGGGTVVLQARDDGGDPVIVASETGGGYRVVADIADFNNANWPALPSINDAGQVAFVAVHIPGGVRVVRAEPEGTFTTIAQWNDAIPAGGTFSNFNAGTGDSAPAISESGRVVFWASFTDGTTQNGIFSGAGSLPGVLRHAWDAPGSFYGRVSVHGTAWAARKLTSPGRILRGVTSAPELGDPLDTAAGLESGPDTLDAPTYVGPHAGGEPGLMVDGVAVGAVAPSAGYSAIRHPDRELTQHAGYQMAFEAVRAGGGRGVFVWQEGGEVITVREVGEPLADGVIADLRFYRGLNASGQVAFWARLEDGREAIVRASPSCIGMPCDDGDACTLDDRCDGRACTGNPDPLCM